LNDSGLQIDQSLQVSDTSDEDSIYEEIYQDLCSPTLFSDTVGFFSLRLVGFVFILIGIYNIPH